jgi:hypothetical protein
VGLVQNASINTYTRSDRKRSPDHVPGCEAPPSDSGMNEMFEEAAKRLIRARESGELISQLSINVQPYTVDETHQIQAATVVLTARHSVRLEGLKLTGGEFCTVLCWLCLKQMAQTEGHANRGAGHAI